MAYFLVLAIAISNYFSGLSVSDVCVWFFLSTSGIFVSSHPFTSNRGSYSSFSAILANVPVLPPSSTIVYQVLCRGGRKKIPTIQTFFIFCHWSFEVGLWACVEEVVIFAVARHKMGHSGQYLFCFESLYIS